jgi:RNA polymerase sigma-70 factor (ECF subfamily)
VKGWLGRAAAGTARRGERGSRVVRWTRWYGRRGPVPEDRFQGPGEPHPGHWRQFPEPWPDGVEADPRVPDLLDHALDDLPAPWQDAVRRRDIRGEPRSPAADPVGHASEEQQHLLNEARAVLRRRLAVLLGRGDPW